MKTGYKIFLAVTVLVFAGVLFMFSPYFYMKEIQVNGLERISRDEIDLRLEIERDENIFLFNTKAARKRLLENLYIDDAVFIKQYPGKLTVNISERHLSGYVEYMDGQFLYIDENGRVLEINSAMSESYPIVHGLKFSRVTLGEVLDVEDGSAFKTMVQYARLLNKHQMTRNVSRIDVSDVSNTKIVVHNLEFSLGDGGSGDEKIRTIKDILDKLPNSEIIKGFVDIRDVSGQYIGKILS